MKRVAIAATAAVAALCFVTTGCETTQRAALPGDFVVFHDAPRLQRTQNSLRSLSRFLEVSEQRGLSVRALPPADVDDSICA